uniref:Uncharacterized protein n=1 Tax=Heterorhabditis bacteriophora TaxID=37862 RepID=A0A1I7WVK0_HETBA
MNRMIIIIFLQIIFKFLIFPPQITFKVVFFRYEVLLRFLVIFLSNFHFISIIYKIQFILNSIQSGIFSPISLGKLIS